MTEKEQMLTAAAQPSFATLEHRRTARRRAPDSGPDAYGIG